MKFEEIINDLKLMWKWKNSKLWHQKQCVICMNGTLNNAKKDLHWLSNAIRRIPENKSVVHAWIYVGKLKSIPWMFGTL